MKSTWPTHIGLSYPGGYTVLDEITEEQGDSKRIYVQKTQFKDDGRIEYRFTYYVIARKGKVQGSPVFGRNSPFIPTVQLASLLSKARAKGWEGF
jgi:hypothetical protein